jgi:thiamine-phosphate pyrophosphorylase
MIQYAITDPAYYGTTLEALELSLTTMLNMHPCDLVCYRDKSTTDYATMARRFVDVARGYEVQVLLHSHPALAAKLHADGVHLTSQQFDQIGLAKAMGLFVIISTHTHEEALRAHTLGADAITYSPIFSTPNKGAPKGLDDLKERVAKIQLPIYALGGIATAEQVAQIATTGVAGFASIRYFIAEA